MVAPAPADKASQPVPVLSVVGVPVPPILVVPVYETPAMVCAVAKPEIQMSPHKVLAKSFHSGSPVSPVEVLLTSILIRPPALKKYWAAAELDQVTVLTKLMVQLAPDVPAVLELVPDQPVNWLPVAYAL